MEVDYEFCRSVVDTGWFNPYREKPVYEFAEGATGE